MRFGGTGGGAGGGGSLDAENLPVTGDPAQAGHDEGERAHVRRLLLHPDNFARGGMRFDSGFEVGFGPGVELVEEEDARNCVLALRALDAQLVSDFAGCYQEALRVFDRVSGRTGRKCGRERSWRGDIASGWRSMLLGVKTMSGLRQERSA